MNDITNNLDELKREQRTLNSKLDAFINSQKSTKFDSNKVIYEKETMSIPTLQARCNKRRKRAHSFSKLS